MKWECHSQTEFLKTFPVQFQTLFDSWHDTFDFWWDVFNNKLHTESFWLFLCSSFHKKKITHLMPCGVTTLLFLKEPKLTNLLFIMSIHFHSYNCYLVLSRIHSRYNSNLKIMIFWASFSCRSLSTLILEPFSTVPF